MELVHDLYASIFEEEFTNHDLYFLNLHARLFLERNNEDSCFGYDLIARRIQELFELVPAPLKSQLEWAGPIGKHEPVGPDSKVADQPTAPSTGDKQSGINPRPG